MNVQDIHLDIDKRVSPADVVRIGQGDKGGTTIRATIFDNGVAADLTGMAARFCMRLPDGIHYVRDTDCTVSGNTITYVVDESHCAAVKGMTDEAYFDILADGETVYSTSRFSVHVLRGVTDGAVPGENYDGAIEDALEAVQEATGNANAAADSANNAVSAANTAAASANQAAGAANTAKASADTAASNANAKATLANSAATAANTAKANADAATVRANEATNSANDAAEDARQAAEEARGAISPELTLYLTYDQVGDTEYLALVDANE